MLLVGMMGAGKSTVASLLADRLDWPLVDTDVMVENGAGATVAEVFDRDGEAVFRAAEAEAIAELEQMDEPLIVSVGGGAILRETNRSAMRAAGTVVWLRARPATLAARVGSGRSRPLLHRGGLTPQAALEQLATEREAYYQDAADLTIDVDDISPSQAADLVMTALASALAL